MGTRRHGVMAETTLWPTKEEGKGEGVGGHSSKHICIYTQTTSGVCVLCIDDSIMQKSSIANNCTNSDRSSYADGMAEPYRALHCFSREIICGGIEELSGLWMYA